MANGYYSIGRRQHQFNNSKKKKKKTNHPFSEMIIQAVPCQLNGTMRKQFLLWVVNKRLLFFISLVPTFELFHFKQYISVLIFFQVTSFHLNAMLEHVLIPNQEPDGILHLSHHNPCLILFITVISYGSPIWIII